MSATTDRGWFTGDPAPTCPRTLRSAVDRQEARSRLARGEVAVRSRPVPNVALFAAWASLCVPIMVALVIWWWF